MPAGKLLKPRPVPTALAVIAFGGGELLQLDLSLRRTTTSLNFRAEAAYSCDMKVNSPQSMALGRKVLREHGSWAAVNKAGVRREDGITVVPRKRDTGNAPYAAAAKK